MKGTLEKAFGYQGDQMNLPVRDLSAALPFYETILGFRIVSQIDTPRKAVVLGRDAVQMGLAENGGDPTQNGCFFEVDNVEAAFTELKARGLNKEDAGYRIDRHGQTSWRVFFVVAPDGLCYCLGQRQV